MFDDRSKVISIRVKSKQLSPKDMAKMRINDDKVNSNNAKKRAEIKEIIYESALDSTTHAIPHIFKRPNYFVKLFWIVCFLASTAFCAWLIAMSTINFFHYETVTKTETVLEIPTNFPTISICNLNPYLTNYSIEFVKNILTQNGLYNPITQVNRFFENLKKNRFLRYFGRPFSVIDLI
jgi:hypothetical protein